MVTVTKSENITLVDMLDLLWTHLSGRVDGCMIAFNELAQTNAQISEHDQVPWTAIQYKRTLMDLDLVPMKSVSLIYVYIWMLTRAR